MQVCTRTRCLCCYGCSIQFTGRRIPYILKYSILSPKVTKSSLFCSTQVYLYIVRYTIGYQDDKRSNIQQASLWIADREGGGQSNLICMHVVLLLFSYLVYALLYVVLHYNIVEHNIHIQQRTVHSITSNTDVQSPHAICMHPTTKQYVGR